MKTITNDTTNIIDEANLLVSKQTEVDVEQLALHLLDHPDCLESADKWDSYECMPYSAKDMKQFFACPMCRMQLVECCNSYLSVQILRLLKQCADICHKPTVSKADKYDLTEYLNLIAHLTDDIMTTTELYGACQLWRWQHENNQ